MRPEPTITVNGKAYFRPTYNLCSVCDPDRKHFLMVKMVLAGNDTLLECPYCDYSITVHPGMINTNADRPSIIGETDKPSFEE